NRESIEAAACYVDQQLVAVAKMPVGRRRAHSCPASSFREGEAGGALLRDQFQRRGDQGLFQIAMVVAAGTWTYAFSGPAHVKGSYMTRERTSTRAFALARLSRAPTLNGRNWRRTRATLLEPSGCIVS